MNFTFSSPEHGTCVVKLWATGRYGFSLPKRVDIAAPDGPACTFLYLNKQLTMTEPDNRTIVRIAIGAFLGGMAADGATVDIDPDMPAYGGKLTPVRLDVPRAPMRVRPGKSHARLRPDAACGSG
ncbi:hypothetical protein NX784_00520 [Massilia pinisoli]|uniref:Uncharacterized protein n=1 Tax=Massilia pinisoli TaxID=1772194 RepID=A0ABT1ZJI3_9BURK|nr:hypothetical protein [Massilia pinisoli]MCS0580066.1 hypothetical protein [Massilia pinisoli]